jgi:hypothetical protein
MILNDKYMQYVAVSLVAGASAVFFFVVLLLIDNQIVPSISQCADWCTD